MRGRRVRLQELTRGQTMANGYRLLMIDDDPEFVEGVTSILEAAGYSVDVQYNPRDGFNALMSGGYDMLLLDIMMGRGAEGVMLARKVRKEPRLDGLPVLVMTSIREQMAFLFPGQPLDPRFVPVEELLEKPVKPEVLLDKVNTLLQAAEERQAEGK
jgi:DNA-binding response OmpR family regulator